MKGYQNLSLLLNSLRKFLEKAFIRKVWFFSNKSLENVYWKKSTLNNKSIAVNVLYVPYNTENIRHAYKSKYNIKRENQVILLMITVGKNNIILP